jgi:hypothetical protein
MTSFLYKSLYSKNHTVYDNINEINNFFFPDDPEIPKLSEEDMLNCEGGATCEPIRFNFNGSRSVHIVFNWNTTDNYSKQGKFS